MASNTHPAILTVNGAPEGIVRLFVPEGIDVGKADLRLAAQRAAKTIDVGRTPAGKAGSVTVKGTKVRGSIFDFAPVQRSKGSTDEAAPSAPAESDPRIDALKLLGLSDEQIASVLAVSAPAPSGKAKGTGGKAKAESAFHARMVAKAKARDAQAAQCDKCLGHGKCRPTPRLAKRTGQPVKFPYAFRTAQGAASAPTGVPCDKCGGAAQTA